MERKGKGRKGGIDLKALMESKAMSNPKNSRLKEVIVGSSPIVVTNLDDKLEKEKKRKLQERKNKRMVERKYQDMCFVKTMDDLGIKCVPEFKFHDKRDWRIDFYIEYGDVCLAVEVEGGVYTGGRHTTPKGFLGDMEKYNQLALYRIWLYRVIPDNLNSKETISNILKLISYDGKRDSGTLFK
jgi:hypothetical protein